MLSALLVAMGVSLGREGAPKQAGAIIANALYDRGRLSDAQRRLLVACGAGAGLAAAYDVPLGGALFALKLLRGALALRTVLPALTTTLVATAVAWIAIPDAPTYIIPPHAHALPVIGWVLIAGPIVGLITVLYVRAFVLADRHRPRGRLRVFAPILVLGILGPISIPFPHVPGNGKDMTQPTFLRPLAPALVPYLVVLKPFSTLLRLGSGAPGGLFTPTLTLGALLGALLGATCTWFRPGVPARLFALVRTGAMLGATTQGPGELAGRSRARLGHHF